MLVDEYQVTFWTRGQYPAAPPHDRNSDLDGRFLFVKMVYRAFTIEKQPPASSGCFQKWSFLHVLFIFGLRISLDNFFIQKLPL